MPILHNSVISAAADSTPADPVTRSLRFESGATHRLTKTFSSAPSSNKVSTLAFWVKRSKLGSGQHIISANGTSHSENTNSFYVQFKTDDTLRVSSYPDPQTNVFTLTTSRKFRDVGAWMHIAILIDTDESAADRCKIFINGVREPAANLTGTTPSSGATNHLLGKATTTSYAGNVSVQHCIGDEADRFRYKYSGYLADFYFIDGSAIEPVGNFIESAGYGSYKPLAFDMSSYGGNSFHLDMQPAHDADLLVTSVGRNDGDTTFADVAAGHTLTDTGDPEHSIAVGNPFTSTGRAIDFGTDDSNYLKIWDGSTDDYNLGSDDFTMEGWYNTYDTEPYGALFGHYQDANNWLNLYVYGDKLRWYYKISGSGLAIVSAADWQHHKWNHVALTRSGTTHKLWQNGVLVATGTSAGGSHTFSASAPLHVGTLRNSSTSFANYHGDGYAYDVRISSSIRYTSDFDVPTEKFTDDSDTELLLQPDNSDSDWNDVDKSHNSHDVTENGTVTRTASTPFDAAAKSSAMYFDGNDTLTGPSDLAFGTGAFTIEFWYQHVSDINGGETGANADIVISKGRRHTNNQGWLLFTHNNGTDKVNWVGYKVDGSSGTNYSLDANSTGVSLAHDGDWHHIAVTRDGSGNMGLFIDGTRYADATGYGGVIDNSSYAVKLASAYDYTSGVTGHYANCYLYDVRITKGEAKYDPTSSSVTKPSAPFELNPVYIGGDQSGNKNHFTPTNISMHDVMLDVPTNNYATLNPLERTGTRDSVSEGNLKTTHLTTSGHGYISSTIGLSSGKWIWAVRMNSQGGGIPTVGFHKTHGKNFTSGSGTSLGYGSTDSWAVLYTQSGYTTTLYNGSSNTTSLDIGNFTNGDRMVVAVDIDAGKAWWGKFDGTTLTWHNSGNPANGTNATATFTAGTAMTPAVSCYNNYGSVTCNFGQDATYAGEESPSATYADSEGNGSFDFQPPDEFLALCTANLDAPSVTPSENFEALTYTGTGSNRDITGLDFQPDLVWIKDRTTGGSNGFHCIHDSVRGDDGTHKHILSSDNTITTDTIYSGYGVTSFNSDGFSIINGGSLSNDSSRNYVAWSWKESASAGFDIVTYEGNSDSTGDTQDISHSLGVAPDMIIVKARDARAYNDYYHEDNWYVWHKDLSSDSLLFLNKSSSEMDYSSGSGYAPINTVGSSTFTVSNEEDGDSYANFLNWGDPYNYYTGDNERYVAYLFSGVEGHSKFGKYSGAGSNGVFVYTGHRPKMVWIKNMGTTGNWFMFDAVRDTYNETVNYLWANSSASETTNSGYKIDILSNGFRINVESTHMNNSAYDYVFCSFAESPFKHANAR